MNTMFGSQPKVYILHGVPGHPVSRDCPYCEIVRLSAEVEGWREKYLLCLSQRDRLRRALKIALDAADSVRQLVDDPLKEPQ